MSAIQWITVSSPEVRFHHDSSNCTARVAALAALLTRRPRSPLPVAIVAGEGHHAGVEVVWQQRPVALRNIRPFRCGRRNRGRVSDTDGGVAGLRRRPACAVTAAPRPVAHAHAEFGQPPSRRRLPALCHSRSPIGFVHLLNIAN